MCITSTNYPKKYPSKDFCEITVVGPGSIDVKDFTVEKAYGSSPCDSDYLEVNGNNYCKDGKYREDGEWQTSLNGVQVPAGKIVWTSDGGVQKKGWKMCLES